MAIYTTTIAQYRATKSKPSSALYALTDDGFDGCWKYDPTDTLTADNGVWCIVNKGGHRLKENTGVPLRVDSRKLGLKDQKVADEILNRFFAELDPAFVLPVLELAPGYYRMQQPLVTGAHRVKIVAPCGGVSLAFQTERMMHFEPGSDGSEVVGVRFEGPGNKTLYDPQGEVLYDVEAYKSKAGILLDSVSTLDIAVKWAAGPAIWLRGNLPAGRGNSSDATLRVQLQENAGANLLIGGNFEDGVDAGTDANHAKISGNFRNSFTGIADKAALGSRVYWAMFHAHEVRHIETTSESNKGTYAALYEENDTRYGDVYTGNAWAQGLFSHTPNCRHNAIAVTGRSVSALKTGSLALQHGGQGLSFQGGGEQASIIVLRSVGEENQTLWEMTNGGEQHYMLRLFNKDALLRVPFSQDYRLAPVSGVEVPHLLTGNRLNPYYVESYAELPNLRFTFKTGDKVALRTPTAGQPAYMLCTMGGKITPDPLPQLTAHSDQNDGGTLRVYAKDLPLQVGQAIQVAGSTQTVAGIYPKQAPDGTPYYVVTAAERFPNMRNEKILAAPAVFTPVYL